MKAKIKPLIILIVIFVATLIAGVAAGCSIGEDTPHDAANGRGMYSSVTYYANGGRFSQSALCYKTLYFEPGKPIYNINEDDAPVGSSKLTISRTNYEFAGWVYAELDDNGNPTMLEMTDSGEITGNVYDELLENGSVSIREDGLEVNEQQKRFTAKISDDPNQWKYAFKDGEHPKLERDEHIYLVAAWVPDVVLDYVLVSDEAVTFEMPKADDPETEEDESQETEEVQLESGAIIKSDSFGQAGYVTLRPNNAPATVVSEHSYIYLFWDEECTKPATSANGTRVNRPQDGENAKIYVKYLPGKWTTVSTALNVSTMLSSLGSNNYYLVDDIDCSTLSLSMTSATFNGTILGNGYTLSNLNLGSSRSPINPSNGAAVSMLGELGESAVIKDLTIKNVTAYVSIRGLDTGTYTVSAYALFTDFAQGATLENFSVEGYSLNITRSNEASVIGNIPLIDGNYETTHWLYGGNSDEEFISAYGNVITNAALTINNDLIIRTGGQQ